ncbi:MAG: hypothetical protein V3S55_15375 [Nitrospiraceae bacterium]
MTVIDILMEDDKPTPTGLHMTIEQKAPLLVDIWEVMTDAEKKFLSKRLPHVA